MKYSFLKKIVSLTFLMFVLGCSQPSSNTPTPPVTLPQIVSMSGATIRIKTTDISELVESSVILMDNGQPIPDGTQFNLVASTVTVSSNNQAGSWQSSLIVSSLNGKFKFYVRPYTIAGLYRVNAYPVESENIKFDQGLNARFFIDVAPGNPSSMGIIKTEQFEDQSPYNNAKDSVENWIVSANPDTISYISVGPVQDQYGNLLDEGTIGLSVNKGEVLSENPGRIISGYAYFAYKADGLVENLSVQASLFHSSNISLSIVDILKKASPQLVYSSNADFSNMSVGSIRCEVISLTNSGAMAATNLDLSATFPFILVDEETDESLCPLTADVCQQRQSLRSGESCKVRIKFQMPVSGSSTGDLISQMSPNEFSGALAIQRLRTDAVSQAQLFTQNSFVSFGGTQCASTRTIDIVVENIGDFDATNISVVNPPPNLNQSSPFFSLILPPQDAIMNPNINAIVNCGTTFPAHRRCRVQVQFNPTAGITNQALIGQLVGDNINPLILTVSGYTIPGQGLNTFPITLLTPNNSVLPLGMNLSSSQQTRIDIGPVVDACNQKVADGSILTASVSAGTLSNATFVTNNGSSTIYWNASNNPADLGSQLLTVNVGAGGSKNASLFFRGINLSLSGSSSFGQVIENKSKTIQLTLTNNGNIDANNLSFSTAIPLVVSDQGTCASGTLAAGDSCVLTILADPQGTNQDFTINVNVSSSTIGVNSISYPLSLNARTKPILSFDQSVYLFNDGTNSSYFERTVTLTNSGPAISYNTTIDVESPFTVFSSTCVSTLDVNQSCQLVIRLDAADANNAVGKTISVSNEVDTNFPVANLAFSNFEFNQILFQSIQGRCVGPINFKLVGTTGTITVSSSVIGSLASNLGGTFYSSSSCDNGTEITQSTISSGNNQSSNFYYKNPNSGIDQIFVENPVVSSGISSIQLNPEIELNVPSPNGLIGGEEIPLIATGGYSDYTYTFSDGSSTSSLANIVNIPDPEDSNLTIGRKLVVLTQSVSGLKVVRVSDSLGFYKDFIFYLYPAPTGGSIEIANNDPTLVPFNIYGNPNTVTFELKRYDSGSSSYISGSLYGSTLDSYGYYTAGASVPGSTIEYAFLTVSKYTGGSSEVIIPITVNLEWPYGTLGDLVVNNGQTVTLLVGRGTPTVSNNYVYDYRNVTVHAGGTLRLVNSNNLTSGSVILGASGNVIINGSIIADNLARTNTSFLDFTFYNPLTKANQSASANQSVGGGGGVGQRMYISGNLIGGFGGAGGAASGCPAGAGGGGGSGNNGNYSGGGGGSCGNSGGNSGSGESGGAGSATGATGGNGGNSGGDAAGQGGVGGGSGGGGGADGSGSTDGAAGAGGGAQGFTKPWLVIRTKGNISGTGLINLAGTSGYNGGNGGNSAGYGGPGGGGGGGAGGNGGNLSIFYKGSNSFAGSTSLAGGSGGIGGSGGVRGFAAFVGCPAAGSFCNGGTGGNGASGSNGIFVAKQYGLPESCLQAKTMNSLNSNNNTGSGIYTIDSDPISTNPPQQVYCDMDTDGGGWTLVMRETGAIASSLPTLIASVNSNTNSCLLDVNSACPNNTAYWNVKTIKGTSYLKRTDNMPDLVVKLNSSVTWNNMATVLVGDSLLSYSYHPASPSVQFSGYSMDGSSAPGCQDVASRADYNSMGGMTYGPYLFPIGNSNTNCGSSNYMAIFQPFPNYGVQSSDGINNYDGRFIPTLKGFIFVK